MERVLVLGANWRRASSARIESLTIPLEQQPERLPELQRRLGVRELTYLATCNRVEVTVVAEDDADLDTLRADTWRELTGDAAPDLARRELTMWGGEGAVEHLFLVAAGLDSAQVGEQEIAGQLRRAVKLARAAGTLGPRLQWVYEQAFKVGKDVQTGSGLRSGRQSLAEIALDHVRGVDDERPVALVGVSPMIERCAESLSAEGARLLFVNRTVSNALRLATRFGGDVLSLDAFRAKPPPIRALVSATGAPGALFGPSELGRIAGERPLLVDLAIPPDIDPAAATAAGLRRIDMDDVTAQAARNSERRKEESAAARALVDDALEEMLHKHAGRSLGPLLGELFSVYERSADESVERLLDKTLTDLPPEQQDQLRRFARGLARRLAHVPAVGLRRLAQEEGMGPVRTFLTASDDPTTARLVALARDDD